ncbi:MAG: lysophospholipid acyltransferase family protein [Myxococcota bacterium]
MAVLSSLLRLLVGLAYMAVAVAVFAVVCVVLLPSRRLRIRACNVFGHVTGRVCLWLAGATIDPSVKRFADAAHPAIYVSNHTSALDIFVGIWLAPLDTCGVAKKQVVWYPFFGQLYAISGHLMLDRADRGQAVEALRDVAELIRKYRIGVWLWPEGTRSKDGRLRPLKKGFVHLAIATRLPVVPVVVTGAHRAWQKNSILLHPTNVGIRVLDPIPTDDWSLDRIDDILADVHRRFAEALPDDQKPIEAQPALRAC